MAGKTVADGVERYGRYIRLAEGATWPLPVGPAEWTLRYGTPSREDILHAASCMNAFNALAALPREEQRKVSRAIRAGVQDYQRAGNSDGG